MIDRDGSKLANKGFDPSDLSTQENNLPKQAGFHLGVIPQVLFLRPDEPSSKKCLASPSPLHSARPLLSPFEGSLSILGAYMLYKLCSETPLKPGYHFAH